MTRNYPPHHFYPSIIQASNQPLRNARPPLKDGNVRVHESVTSSMKETFIVEIRILNLGWPWLRHAKDNIDLIAHMILIKP